MAEIKRCENDSTQMGLLKNNRFLTKEAINDIPCTEKGKKVPVCEMLQSPELFPFSMLPMLSWKLKIIAYRGRPTIPKFTGWSCFFNKQWFPDIIFSERASF